MTSAFINESRLLTGVCPLGWTYQLSSCFFYNVGASTYRQAATFCQTERAVVLPTLMLADLQPMINNFITYEDLDGTEKRSVIWLSIGKKNIRSCPVYPANVKEKRSTDIGETNCNELHPFICKQTSVVRCKNSCFNKGSCIGTTCVCFRFVTVLELYLLCKIFTVSVLSLKLQFIRTFKYVLFISHTKTHIQMCTHTHKYIHKRIHTYIHTQTHTQIQSHTRYIHTHKHILIHVFVLKYYNMSICLCLTR